MKKMMKFALIAMSALALAVAGCGGDDDDSSGEGGGGGTGLGGGTYTLTITDVVDGCYGGAMKSLVMPDLPDMPTIAGVELPAGGAGGTIPKIAFNDPFPAAENVAVVASGDNGLTTSSPIELKDTNISAGGTCIAKVTIEATLTYSTDDALAGTATMKISDLPDPADDCPVLDGGDACEITVTLTGAKE
jgi:hypothetical protein